MELSKLQKIIGYTFKDEKLLRLALTHSSYVNEHRLTHADCNERIEFLGDAVLELASSDFLYNHYQDLDEGKLTKIRASLVCEMALAEIARDISLGDYIVLGKGEDASGGRLRDSILSDALESLIGAIYIDGGFTNAKEFIVTYVLKDIETRRLFFDSKTILQELAQSRSLGDVSYVLVSEDGPDHAKTFVSEVIVAGQSMGSGSGHSKKLSEQKAAYEAILKLG